MPITLKAIVLAGPLLDVKQIEREAKALIDAQTGYGKDQYEKTTEEWDTKPDFQVKRASRTGQTIMGSVTTDNEVFIYVDQGTRPHIITARRAPMLAFQTGYKAKTVPKQFRSRAGGKFGPWARKYSVRHPGTEARGWTEILADEIHDGLVDGMVDIMLGLARKSRQVRTVKRG